MRFSIHESDESDPVENGGAFIGRGLSSSTYSLIPVCHPLVRGGWTPVSAGPPGPAPIWVPAPTSQVRPRQASALDLFPRVRGAACGCLDDVPPPLSPGCCGCGRADPRPPAAYRGGYGGGARTQGTAPCSPNPHDVGPAPRQERGGEKEGRRFGGIFSRFLEIWTSKGEQVRESRRGGAGGRMVCSAFQAEATRPPLAAARRAETRDRDAPPPPRPHICPPLPRVT